MPRYFTELGVGVGVPNPGVVQGSRTYSVWPGSHNEPKGLRCSYLVRLIGPIIFPVLKEDGLEALDRKSVPLLKSISMEKPNQSKERENVDCIVQAGTAGITWDYSGQS